MEEETTFKKNDFENILHTKLTFRFILPRTMRNLCVLGAILKSRFSKEIFFSEKHDFEYKTFSKSMIFKKQVFIKNITLNKKVFERRKILK